MSSHKDGKALDINKMADLEMRILELEKKLANLKGEPKAWEYPEVLEEKPKFNEPWKPKIGEKYFYIDPQMIVWENLFLGSCIGVDLINYGNCFQTYDQAEQRAKEIKVYNLLKNFSDANGGDKINILDTDIDKYYIQYDIYDDKFTIISGGTWLVFNDVPFISKEVATEALRRFKTELEELIK